MPEPIVKEHNGRKLRKEVYLDPQTNQEVDRIVDVDSGQVLQSRPRFKQYGSAEAQDAISKLGSRIVKSSQNQGVFSTQHQTNQGVYKSDKGQDHDWGDLAKRHPWIASAYKDKGGYEQFVKDVQDPTKTKETTTWFQKEAGKRLKDASGVDYFQPENSAGKNPYKIDGAWGNYTHNIPGVVDPEPEKPAVKSEPDLGSAQAPDPAALTPEGHKEKGWWLQDIAGFADSLLDRVNKYDPALQQVSLDKPDYTLLDPSRQLAAQQEQAARFQELAQNTAAGSVARSNILAQAGTQGEQAADILARTENANVQIVNQASGASSAVQNQEEVTNAKLRDEFVGRQATANQQFDNAKAQLKAKRLAQFLNGVTNSQRQRQMEDVLFPQYAVDRTTGQVHYSGVGKNPFVNDGSQGSTGSAADTTEKMATLYADSYTKGINKGMSPEAARDFAKSQQQMYMPRGQQNSAAMYQKLMMGAGAPVMPQMGGIDLDPND